MIILDKFETNLKMYIEILKIFIVYIVFGKKLVYSRGINTPNRYCLSGVVILLRILLYTFSFQIKPI